MNWKYFDLSVISILPQQELQFNKSAKTRIFKHNVVPKKFHRKSFMSNWILHLFSLEFKNNFAKTFIGSVKLALQTTVL